MDETIVTNIKSLAESEILDPYLMIISGANIGKLFNLNADEFIAGRLQDCQIWIEDTTISRKHFRILRNSNNECTIIDLDSTNGTYINNKRVTSAVLKGGDKIQISKDTIILFDYFDESRRISEQRRYEMGVKDPVTNTYNKSYFLQRITEEFSFCQRQNLPLSVIMFDIDHFKLINDTYGHLAGDQCLQEVCELISKVIRQDDVFCRYGGEEFVIIMRNTEGQAAVNLAERVRQKIETTPVFFDGQNIRVTVSSGVATAQNENYRDYMAFMADADRHLYRSKGSGRNRVSGACAPNLPIQQT
jgi:diguanylate cyclase (GGDEF)-like protein